MRIKLSKSDWRLVGNKMGWLKRAQVAGNPTLPAAPGAPGAGKAKVTPKVLPNQPNSNYSSLPTKFTSEQQNALREVNDLNNRLQQDYLRSENTDWLSLATGFQPYDRQPSANLAWDSINKNPDKLDGILRVARERAETTAQLRVFEKDFEIAFSKLTATRKLVYKAFQSWWGQWLAEGNLDGFQPNNNSSLPVKFTEKQRTVLDTIKRQNDFWVKNFINNKNPDWRGLATKTNAAIRNYTDSGGDNAPKSTTPSVQTANSEIYSLDYWLKDFSSKAMDSSQSPEQKAAYSKEFETASGMLSKTKDIVEARFMDWWEYNGQAATIKE